MDTTDEIAWVIQWRYNPEELVKWMNNTLVRAAWQVPEKSLKHLRRWHNCAYWPHKNAEYLYSVHSMKEATKHTLEEAMQLWYKMRNSWKFDEAIRGGFTRPRIVRLYNVHTKEEVFPAQIDPGCIG